MTAIIIKIILERKATCPRHENSLQEYYKNSFWTAAAASKSLAVRNRFFLYPLWRRYSAFLSRISPYQSTDILYTQWLLIETFNFWSESVHGLLHLNFAGRTKKTKHYTTSGQFSAKWLPRRGPRSCQRMGFLWQLKLIQKFGLSDH